VAIELISSAEFMILTRLNKEREKHHSTLRVSNFHEESTFVYF